ncbi:hypothetical protein JTB14_021103 [Gonioctena quinquepunctata]|nr:hypothetical protein JTB14_021103 [Gonioctena quinquepunctata]
MIEPAGAIIYASPSFTGSISDKGIIEASGFLNISIEKVDKGQISPGDVILADKGFNVIDLFQGVNVNINIPVFEISGTQFTAEEVVTTRNIAKDRIHVERAIGRLKTYKILCSPIPIVSSGTMEQIYTVCVLLCNFRYGSIQENKKDISHLDNNVSLT